MFISLIILLIIIYLPTAKVVMEPSLPTEDIKQMSLASPKVVVQTKTHAMPVYQEQQSLRNPFSLPPSSDIEKNNLTVPMPQNHQSDNTIDCASTKVSPESSHSVKKFMLTGIVGTKDKQLAVIKFDNKSQSYSVNEIIDLYTISAINDDSVVLKNETQQIVLKLEGTGRGGGNHREK